MHSVSVFNRETMKYEVIKGGICDMDEALSLAKKEAIERRCDIAIDMLITVDEFGRATCDFE